MFSFATVLCEIFFSAISHRLLRDYLPSSKSHTHTPQSQDENENEAGCTEVEAMMSDSDEMLLTSDSYGRTSNSSAFDSLGWSIPILGNVMEALTDPNTHLIGVYGLNDEIKDGLLQKVYRRVQRDQTFGMVVTASITKYPDLTKIQENIATQLGFTFNHVRKDKRAIELVHRIKDEQSILIVLRDFYKGFDLSTIGIPCSADYKGCKVLLTSISEDVLSNYIHTQKNFMV